MRIPTNIVRPHSSGSSRNVIPEANLLAYLRWATRREHARIERHSVLAPLLRADLTPGDYARVLGAFWTYYGAFEATLRRVLSQGVLGPTGAYRYHPRVGLLQQDLEDLGAHRTLRAALNRPLGSAPTLQTPDAVLGTLYVLEGATQGGRVIAPAIDGALGLDAGYGARYFNLYRERQWPAFRALVGQRAAHHDPEQVAETARHGFTALMDHLDEWSDVSDGRADRGGIQ